MLVAQESWRAPLWPGTAKPQYSASPSRSVQALRSLQLSTTDAGAAQLPCSVHLLGSIDEGAGGAGVVKWCCKASVQRSTFNAGTAAPPCSAPRSKQALCYLLAALHLPGSVGEDAGGTGVVEWRCQASVQRLTFNAGAATPPCSAPHSKRALCCLLAVLHLLCRRCYPLCDAPRS